jgi:hypothetical protein
MGTEHKLKLEAVIAIFDSIKDIEGNTKLDTTTAYRLGRLFDRAKSIIRVFEKVQNQLKQEISQKVNDLREDMESKSDAEKAKINKEVRTLNEEFTKKVESMLEQEETIKIPDFNIKDFEGKGVSVKFFSGMADFIKE